MGITEFEMRGALVMAAKCRAHPPHALSAAVGPDGRLLTVALSDGTFFTVPVRMVQGIDTASVSALRTIEIWGGGCSLHFPELDVDLYVPALLQGIVGNRAWMDRQKKPLPGAPAGVEVTRSADALRVA